MLMITEKYVSVVKPKLSVFADVNYPRIAEVRSFFSCKECIPFLCTCLFPEHYINLIYETTN